MQAFSETDNMIFACYEDELRIKRVGPDTWRNYRATRDRFLRWTTERGLSPEDVTHRDMLAYIGSMADLEPSTVQRHWRTLHAAYRRAAGKYKLIDEDPTDGLPLPPVRQTRPFAFSASDLRDIKAQISRPQDWLSFHLLAYTGMRSIEVRRLRWDDINFVKNTLRVTGKQTRRGDDERLVPIHPAPSRGAAGGSIGTWTARPAGAVHQLARRRNDLRNWDRDDDPEECPSACSAAGR